MDIPNDWDWHVEGWHAGCSRSGCSYNFNVTVPSILDQIAGVKAYCSGPETGNTYRSCQILEGVNDGVSAKFGPRNESSPELGPEKIFVSFELGSYEER
ncbi:hypothetical protein CC78DRAFT_535033 [Lojkania enalia]|uniref:Uncharacterized protein n=1 Tax=Lojkania enalia TaxID=147567 RepID=A0A9P4K398_9PLEO|nr:hypothetical protein CC78DRAFT_535033 [Didymosphaeria enalia]